MQINAPAVVQWQDGNYVHMSVIDDNKNSRPVQMRCIVLFNRQNGYITTLFPDCVKTIGYNHSYITSVSPQGMYKSYCYKLSYITMFFPDSI